MKSVVIGAVTIATLCAIQAAFGAIASTCVGLIVLGYCIGFLHGAGTEISKRKEAASPSHDG